MTGSCPGWAVGLCVSHPSLGGPPGSNLEQLNKASFKSQGLREVLFS